MAAQDAELQLKVSLDLAFFRQQLAGLGSAVAGTPLKLQVQFDRTSLTKQLTLLSNSLSRKKYDVEIKSTSLKSLLDKVDAFKKTLTALKTEDISLDVKVEADISKTKGSEARRNIINAITGGPGKAIVIPTAVKNPLVKNIDEVRASIKRNLGTIEVDVKASLAGGAADSDAIKKKILGETEAIALPLQVTSPNRDNIRQVRADIKEKLSGIKIQVQAELSGASLKSAGAAKSPENYSQAQLRKLGQDIKPLYRAAADAGLVEFNKTIANNIQEIARELSGISKDSIAGLLNGLKGGEPQIKAAAKSLGQALIVSIKDILGIASPSKVFKALGEDVGKGFELGAVGSMDKAFDALERQLQERLKRLQSILSLSPSRRSAFPFVATGGRLESGPIAREIDQAYAKIAQIQERRQGRLATERGSLAQMAGRLLPPARDRSLPAARETIFPGGGALDQVTQGFVQSLRNTRDTLARNFSANTYLPRATRALATSMDVATKQLSGTKIAGLLPSKEMMEPLRFQRAQQKAAQIDAENIARAQAEQALNQQNLRGMFQGVPRINAPRVGQEETPIGRHIQNKIEQAIQNARQTLGLPLGPSSTFVPSPFAGAATVPPRQFFQPTMQAALPPAGGTGPIAAAQRNIAEMQKSNDRMLASANRAIATIDRIIEAGRGITGNAPSAPPSQSGFAAWSQQMTAKYGGGNVPPVPPIPPGGGGGGDGGMGPSSQLPPGYHMLGTLPTQLERASEFLNQRTLPLTSAIKNLGIEFGHAAQQVLLYGTAYKALAFFTSLPGQAFEAAKNLEVFRNQLDAVTQSTGQFGPSLKFIENSVKELNIPIDSAREGFTRLFASLQPAGFDPGSIQNLFGGITKAAATFGLSADQVDRVFYAFGQMASKGQVMSEELKGQLGDVLPGSVALFAEAAKMSMTEFTQALENGMFKGDAMKVLLENVAILMNTKFSDAASKASKTLQGQMNAMQNSLQTMYESLQPMVNAFAAVVGPIVQGMIKDATDVIRAFTDNLAIGGEGFNLLTPRAQDFYTALKNIIPSIVSAAQNIGSFISSLSVLVQPLTAVAKLILDFISIPLVARVALYATIIGTLTGAFQLLVSSGIVQATAAIIRFMSTLSIAQIQGWIASISAAIAKIYAMVAAFNAAKLAAMALKVTLISFGVGAVLLGLDFVAQRLLNIGNAADDARRKAAGLTDELNRAAEAGDIAAAQTKQQEIETQLQSIEKAMAILNRLKGGKLQISQAEFETLQRTGLATGINYMGGAATFSQGQLDANLKAAQQGRIEALNKAGEADEAVAEASRVAINRQRQIDASRQQLKDIPPGATDGKAQSGAEKLANQQQQAAIDAANSQNALNKAIMEGRMSLDDQAFQHQLALIDARNSYELAGLNSIQARQEKFQQDLQKLELDRISIIRKAEQDAAKAVADYRAAENTAAAAGEGGEKGLPSGMTQYITGDPSSPYYQADHGGGNYHEHLAFASRALAEAAYQQLTKAGVQVTEFQGRSPVGRHTPGSAHYSGLAFDIPGSQVPVGQEKQLTAKVQSILGIGGGASTRERRADKAVGKLQVEQTQMATQQEMAARTAIMATNEALEKRSALIKANINTIFPVAEQKLENDLMKVRNDLQLQGMPQEYIKYQEDLVKANYEMEERIKRNKEETEDYEKAVAALQEKQKNGIALTANEMAALKANTEAIAQNKQELQDLAKAQKEYQIAALESAIATMKNADAMKAMEEVSNRINQAVEGVTGSYKDMFKEIAKGGDSVEALKKLQDALADQALTMFFDFAMQPVEKFFKDQLGAIFGVPSEEEKRQEQLTAMEKQLAELKAARETQQRIDKNVEKIANGGGPGAQQGTSVPGIGGIMTSGGVGDYAAGAVTQLPEALGSLTESANAYSEELGKVDASVWGSAASLSQAGKEMSPNGATGKTWQQSLGSVVSGIGMAAGSIMSIMAGINQVKEGGTSNVLGGIGSIMTSVGGLLGGFSGMFGGGSAGQFGTSSSFNGTADALGAAPFAPKLGAVFADGGIARGGFRAFANGGIVNGPTLGLMGEGRYNEAIVPLPDGKSIPVQMRGQSSRDLLSGNARQQSSSPVLSMSFQTTKFGDREYVDVAQLQAAMAETRKMAARDGANRGASLALDKLQNSPSARRKVGMR